MKHLSNIIELEQLLEKDRAVNQGQIEDKPSHETASVINWLFSELRSNFTAFRLAWPDDEAMRLAKKTWLKAFMLAGINKVEQLQFGLKKCYLLEKPFMPSPGQFIAWCKPSAKDLGFPSDDDAYRISIEINRQFSDYRHEDERVDTVIRHAVKNIGALEYRLMKTDDARKAFARNYEISFKQFTDGELKPIPKAIASRAEEHPDDKPKIRRSIAQIIAEQEIERAEMGVTLLKYHAYILSKPR